MKPQISYSSSSVRPPPPPYEIEFYSQAYFIQMKLIKLLQSTNRKGNVSVSCQDRQEWFGTITNVGFIGQGFLDSNPSSLVRSFTFYLAKKTLVCAGGGGVFSDASLPRSSFVSPAPNSSSILMRVPPQEAPCLGLASGTAPKLAPAFKQIHSSFLSGGAEGGGYYPRVEMSSDLQMAPGLVPSAPGYRQPSPSLTSQPGLKLDQLRRIF